MTHFFPSHGGGIEKVALALATELAGEQRAAIVWFASDCDPGDVKIAGVDTIPVRSWNGIEERTGLPYPLWHPSAWPALWRAIRQAEVVHVHDYVYSGSLLAWMMAMAAGRPIVITQHVGHVSMRSGMASALLRLSNLSLGRLVLGTSAAAVFVSDVVRRQFFRNRRKRVHVIANGVDLSVFRPGEPAGRQATRRSLGIDDDRPVLLFVGRFVTKKGLPLLQQLVPLFPGVHWIFAGRGPLDPAQWSLPHVTVIRVREGPGLAELYRLADLLVLPSVGEGFPLVIQEALACGTPVLCGSELAGALPGIGGVVEMEDVTEPGACQRWQQRLKALLDDRAALALRRTDAARFAAEHWSWEACATAYIDLYRKAISGRTDRR